MVSASYSICQSLDKLQDCNYRYIYKQSLLIPYDLEWYISIGEQFFLIVKKYNFGPKQFYIIYSQYLKSAYPYY